LRVVPPATAGVQIRGDALGLGPDAPDLLVREAALRGALLEQPDGLPPPRPVVRHPDVELEVLRVVFPLRPLRFAALSARWMCALERTSATGVASLSRARTCRARP
jgi:hypothetical protein